MPLRAILRLAFNLSSPVEMFLFKRTLHSTDIITEIWSHLRERENQWNKSSHHSVRQRVGLGRDFKLTAITICAKCRLIWLLSLHADGWWDNSCLKIYFLFEQSSDWGLIGNPLSDTIQNLLPSRIPMLMLLEKYLIKKDNPRSSLCFGCPPRCFLLINIGLTSLIKVFLLLLHQLTVIMIVYCHPL